MTLDEAIKKIAELEARVSMLEARQTLVYSPPTAPIAPPIFYPPSQDTFVPHYISPTYGR